MKRVGGDALTLRYLPIVRHIIENIKEPHVTESRLSWAIIVESDEETLEPIRIIGVPCPCGTITKIDNSAGEVGNPN